MELIKEYASKLTWVDCIVVVAVLRGCYVGYRSGFFPELLRVISYIATAIAAFYFKKPVADYLVLNTFLNQTVAEPVALVALFLAVYIVAKICMWSILTTLKVSDGNFISKLIGTILGVTRWLIILSLVFALVDKVPVGSLKDDIYKNSLTGKGVIKIAPTIFDFLSHLSPQLGITK